VDQANPFFFPLPPADAPYLLVKHASVFMIVLVTMVSAAS
jgi:hypothetical protein